MPATFTIDIHFSGYAITENTEDGPVERWIQTFEVCAQSPRGEVWALVGSTSKDEGAARDQLAALDHDPASRPEAWVECEPVYGSEAWGPEAEYNLACFEADAFNEPRPQW
jgi:hypothetical protein